jgi:hypothetical protein
MRISEVCGRGAEPSSRPSMTDSASITQNPTYRKAEFLPAADRLRIAWAARQPPLNARPCLPGHKAPNAGGGGACPSDPSPPRASSGSAPGKNAGFQAFHASSRQKRAPGSWEQRPSRAPSFEFPFFENIPRGAGIHRRGQAPSAPPAAFSFLPSASAVGSRSRAPFPNGCAFYAAQCVCHIWHVASAA